MLSHDDIAEFRRWLREIEESRIPDSRILLQTLAVLHKDLLDRATQSDEQFFPSYVAKNRFVVTRLRLDTKQVRALTSLLTIATDPRRARSIVNESLPQSYTSLLNTLINASEREWFQEHHNQSQNQSQNQVQGENEVLLPLEQEQPYPSDDGTIETDTTDAVNAHTVGLAEAGLSPVAHKNTVAAHEVNTRVTYPVFTESDIAATSIEAADVAADSYHRFVVLEIGTRMQTAAGEICVLQCLHDSGSELRVALQGAALHLADLVWVGATIHLTHVRYLSDGRATTTAESLCVLEPDLLVDVTEIAECFQQQSYQPLVSLVRRLHQSTAGEAVVLGSIINSCFDDIIQQPDKDFDSMFHDACMARPISCIAALTAEKRLQLKDTVIDHVERLRAAMRTVEFARAFVEPSFISPVYGLQGRLDVLLEHDDNPLHKTIIELKSGSAPTISGSAAFGQPQSRVWPNHEAQIACYHLLLQSAYPGRYGDSQILYSKATDRPRRNVDITPSILRRVMECRNSIIHVDHEIRSKNFRSLTLVCENSDSFPPFMSSAIESLRSIVRDNDEMYLFAKVFMFLLTQESYHRKVGASNGNAGFSALWNASIAEKKLRSSILSDLRLQDDQDEKAQQDEHSAHEQYTAHEEVDDGILTFLRPHDKGASSVFRVGDIVVVYPFNSDSSHMVYHGVQRKGSIRFIDAKRVVVKLRGSRSMLSPLEKRMEWACEPDYIESSSASTMASFMTFFRAPDERKKTILGRTPPRTSLRTSTTKGTTHAQEILVAGSSAPMQSEEAGGEAMGRNVGLPTLNKHQKEILEAALCATDYYLLQGPPGTGKTSVMLRSMVESICRSSEETLLVAAYTNRAVDEICRVLKHTFTHGTLVRMGRRENTEHPDLLFQTHVREYGLDSAEQTLRTARVVVATTTFLNSNPELFEICSFTTAIIDEAAQILEPHMLGIVSKVKRFILIGDEKQLPPVLSLNESLRRVSNPTLHNLGIEDLQGSLFDRLLRCCIRNSWTHAFGMLTHQGRMHRDISIIASEMFYAGKLETLSGWQSEPLPQLSSAQTITPRALPALAMQSIAQARCAFVETAGTTPSKTNRAEALLCADLAEMFHAQCAVNGEEWDEMKLGIITPFRAQIQEIKMLLPESIRDTIVVDTVERFQGSERDIIILSTVVSAVSQLSSIQSMVNIGSENIDRKLNVALTRARHRFILLGDSQVLRHMPQYGMLIDYIARIGAVVATDRKHR